MKIIFKKNKLRKSKRGDVIMIKIFLSQIYIQ